MSLNLLDTTPLGLQGPYFKLLSYGNPWRRLTLLCALYPMGREMIYMAGFYTLRRNGLHSREITYIFSSNLEGEMAFVVAYRKMAPKGSGIIRTCGPVGIGVVLLKEVFHCGGRL